MKKALLVGVNKYKIPGSDLSGCLNDVQDVGRLLMDLYGFKAADIVSLRDAEATTKRMRTELTNLTKKAKAGDSLVFLFSGHGSNVPDKNGDEADGRDEILCAHDLNWSDPILDDWLRRVFNTLPKGANLTVLFDCCHSGTATRLAMGGDRRSKYLACPLDLMAAESGKKLKGKVLGARTTARAAGTKRSDVVTVDLPEVLLSGCRSNQTSMDAEFDNRPNGALVYYTVQTLRANPRLTYRQLHAAVKQQLANGDYDQVPQLEGRAARLDQLVFS